MYSRKFFFLLPIRVSTEFRRHGIPRNFLTSEVISAQFRRNSAKFRGIPRNFAGIAPEITSVFRGMPKCHFRGHPTADTVKPWILGLRNIDEAIVCVHSFTCREQGIAEQDGNRWTSCTLFFSTAVSCLNVYDDLSFLTIPFMVNSRNTSKECAA